MIDAGAPGALGLDELDARGAAATDFDFEASWRSVAGDDVLTLIYTSGTGPPKGVQITHANELAQCRGLDDATGWRTGGGSVVSFLPNAHIADRGMIHYAQMIRGADDHHLSGPGPGVRACRRRPPDPTADHTPVARPLLGLLAMASRLDLRLLLLPPRGE